MKEVWNLISILFSVGSHLEAVALESLCSTLVVADPMGTTAIQGGYARVHTWTLMFKTRPGAKQTKFLTTRTPQLNGKSTRRLQNPSASPVQISPCRPVHHNQNLSGVNSDAYTSRLWSFTTVGTASTRLSMVLPVSPCFHGSLILRAALFRLNLQRHQLYARLLIWALYLCSLIYSPFRTSRESLWYNFIRYHTVNINSFFLTS